MASPSEQEKPRYPVRLVASRTGLTPHVLRAWERRYRVVVPQRSDGGQRLYSDRDIEVLTRLRRLTDDGHAIGRIASLPLDELKRMEEDSSPADDRPLPRRRGAVEDPERAESIRQSIEDVLSAARRLDAGSLQAVLERAAVTLGVPVFIDEVVSPAIARIGHGWAEGSMTVAQEHMSTAVFRRTLGWLLKVFDVNGPAPHLVVATPPGQVHELGALMVAASAAAEGWKVTYLGPDLPLAELMGAASQTGARAVAVSVVYRPDEGELLAALRDVRAGLPAGVPLLVGGAAISRLRGRLEATGALVLDSLSELRGVLRRLAAGAES